MSDGSGVKHNKEQRRIIRALKKKKDVKVIAVAGSGKTTTILGLAGEDINVLLLCYNNRLRTETMSRIDPEMTNIEVHTFHSFCHSVLGEQLSSTDIGIIKITKTGSQFPLIYGGNIPKYDLIIVDEAQDITSVYYDLLVLLLDYTGAKLCLLGDPRQAIYQFNGANEDYLINAEKHFDRKFTELTLSESFRLTRPMAKFINGMYEGSSELAIKSSKKSKISPIIFHRSGDSSLKQIIETVSRFPPGDILILMHSVKRSPKRPSIILANELLKRGINVTYGGFAHKESTEDSVLMLSYHQSKGLERPVVILLDLGTTYFDLSGEDPTKVPNLWYVAMTRSSSILIVYLNAAFEFVNNGLTAIGKCTPDYLPYTRGDANDGAAFVRKRITFDDFIRYTPSSKLWEIINSVDHQRLEWKPIFNGVATLNVTPNSHITEVMIEYIKTYVCDNTCNIKSFVSNIIPKLQGGLNYEVDIGNCWYGGYPILSIEESLDTILRVFKKFMETVGIEIHRLSKYTKKEIPGDNVRALYDYHEIIDRVTGKEVIVIAGSHSLNAKIRIAMMSGDGYIVDLISGHYAAVSTLNSL